MVAMTTIHDSGVPRRREVNVNRNILRLVAAAVGSLLIIAACGVGSGSPAATDHAATPPSSATAPTLPPTPTPAPQASATPIDTTGWVPFSSDRFGYDMAIPPTWTPTPAIRDWSLEAATEVDPGADHFIESAAAYPIGVQAFSAPVPANTSSEEWIAALIPPDATYEGCTPMRIGDWEAITIDGRAALFNPDACSASQAFAFVGDRAYVFSVWREDQQALLKAFLSTVRFHP
jgi:hypothetical protein